jgi:excisionase family DNA binding protein
MTEEKKMYTPRDVANLLGYSTVDGIRRYILNGQLKATKFNGTYIIYKDDLDDFIKARSKKE